RSAPRSVLELDVESARTHGRREGEHMILLAVLLSGAVISPAAAMQAVTSEFFATHREKLLARLDRGLPRGARARRGLGRSVPAGLRLLVPHGPRRARGRGRAAARSSAGE